MISLIFTVAPPDDDQSINHQYYLHFHFDLFPENNFGMIVTEMASGIGFIILLIAINKGKNIKKLPLKKL